MRIKLFYLLLVALSFGSCEWLEDDDTNPYTSGQADFSKYVAIGNSLASGFMDGDLYRDGQFVSYPYQLSLQMSKANGGAFVQPLMVDNTGFGNRIVFDYLLRMPRLAGDTPNPANKTNIADQGPFQNMGVPGATVGDLTALTLASPRAESYYKRFAKAYGQMSILDEVMAQKPTFVTLWIGSNDVLGYGLRGGDIADAPDQDITTTANFRTRFQAVADRLGDTKGVVGNIPEIGVIPYFDMRKIMKQFMNLNIYDSLVLSQVQADKANAAIEAAEKATGHSYNIRFVAGRNAALVEDPNSELPAPYNFRKIQASDNLVLQLLADYSGFTNEINVKGLGWAGDEGVRPIPHKYVLDATERARIETATSAFNQIISEVVATKPNLHLVDLAGKMNELKDGISLGEGPTAILFTTDYLTGSFFSLDGVHPKGQGSAIIANTFIEGINKHFGSNLPLIDVRVVTK